VRPGDLVVGLPSAGLHTNGYSLARHVFFERMGLQIGDSVDDLPGRPRLRDVLLAPHLSYQAALSDLLLHPALHALAHITGGGLTDNLPRVLPERTHVEIRLGAWEIPPLFHLLQERGEVATEEMLRVFNMGLGMVALVAPEGLREVLRVLKAQKVTGSVIGSVQKGGRGVVFELERRAEEKEP
jgi:phosphoribosylformylglycinamidine cyclo-ligase